MRRFSPLFLALVTTLSIGAVGAIGSAAQAQSTIRTPLTAPIELTGTSGGREASACGNINTTAGQVVQVTEAFASLNFKVQSTGDYTLLIKGPDGFSECVFAHNYDGGGDSITWNCSTRAATKYMWGDRRGESHPYTLSIYSIGC